MEQKILHLILLLSISSLLLSPAEASSRVSGCIIRVQDEIVLVRDVWSGRYSIPLASVEAGESIAEAAQRAVLDDVGIFVEPVELLMVSSEQLHVFDCRLKGSVIPTVGHYRILQPKSAYHKVAEVALIRPNSLPDKKWQFQSQISLIKDLFSRVTPQSTSVLVSADLAPSRWIQMELNGIRKLQAWKSSVLTQFFLFFSFLGGETIFLLVLPFLWIMFNRRLGIETAFLFCLSIMVHLLLKQIFQEYRPFLYDPSLQMDHARGFGFPSGHTVAMVLMWGFVALRFSFPFRWVLVLAMSFFGGISRVYLGVHFFQDVVGGWVLGAVILGGYHFYLTQTHQKEISVYLWSCIALYLSTAVLLVSFHPETTALVAILVGVMSGVWFSSSRWVKKRFPAKWLEKRVRFLIVILGIFLIEKIANWAFPKDAYFSLCLIHNVIKYLLIGFWIGIQVNSRALRTESSKGGK